MTFLKHESINRIGDWCGTYSGGQFWPLDPKTEDVNINDIAHALSQICRFNGHSKFFYSVAQHSLNVAKLMKKNNLSSRFQLLGLLHDASEAYICDIPRPLKNLIPEYKEAEKNIQEIIFKALSISLPTKEEEYIIKMYDDALLSIEAAELMTDSKRWNLPKTELKCDIKLISSYFIENLFIQFYEKLREEL